MNCPPGLPISPQDWEQTPRSVQAVVIALWQENQLLKQQVVNLQSQVECLQLDFLATYFLISHFNKRFGNFKFGHAFY